MNRTMLTIMSVLALIGAAAVLALWLRASHSNAVFIPISDRAQIERGRDIYLAQCAACHGVKGEGQPDWRQRLPNGRLPAPPHDETGHTWHHPDGVLFDIVKHGLVPGRTAPQGYESDMPAYGMILSDADIVAVLAYIKSTWSKEVRALQAEVTRTQAH